MYYILVITDHSFLYLYSICPIHFCYNKQQAYALTFDQAQIIVRGIPCGIIMPLVYTQMEMDF